MLLILIFYNGKYFQMQFYKLYQIKEDHVNLWYRK